MPSSTTSVVHTGWFERLRSAFGGILTGLAIVLGSLFLLFWNEGRAVDAIKTNKEGASSVVSVSSNTVAAKNDGQLIHVSGQIITAGMRQDPALGVKTDALVLTRKVEYFQWREDRKTESQTRLGGGEETITTYSYETEWSDFAKDSKSYHLAKEHHNPEPSLKEDSFRAAEGKLGAFAVDNAVLNSITAETPLAVDQKQAVQAAELFERKVSLSDGALYVGEDPASPKVGDMRIRYHVAAQASAFSVIGAQKSGFIKPYTAKTGSDILMVRSGMASADEMFQQAKAANRMMTWILRGLGLMAAIAGLKMILSPIAVLADVLPIAGSIVRVGTGFIATVFGLALSILTIALAWFFYRPLLTAVLVALVAGGLYGFNSWRKKQASNAAATAAPAANVSA